MKTIDVDKFIKSLTNMQDELKPDKDDDELSKAMLYGAALAIHAVKSAVRMSIIGSDNVIRS